MGINNIIPYRGYDYVAQSNPTGAVNPSAPYVRWLNAATGEVFVCLSTVSGKNIWRGDLGNIVGVGVVRKQDVLLCANLDNATIYDRSNYGRLYVATGPVMSAGVVPKFGVNALYFDGSNDYISYADTTDLNLKNYDFTMSCWVYPVAYPASNAVIMCRWQSAGESQFRVTYSSTGQLGFNIMDVSGNSVSGSHQTNITTGAWHHVVFSREGFNLNLFLDGVKDTTPQTLNRGIRDTTCSLNVGRNEESNVWYANMYLQDLLIARGSMYSADFTPPTALTVLM